MGEVFLLDERSFRSNYMRGGVAFFACDAGMLVHQRIAGLTMIELLEGWLPMNEGKIRAIVFQVTPHAVLAIGIAHSQLRVEAFMCRQTLRNLLMTIQTLESRRAGAKLVATRALRCTAQELMCFGKWARRNLGIRGSCGKEKSSECAQQDGTKS